MLRTPKMLYRAPVRVLPNKSRMHNHVRLVGFALAICAAACNVALAAIPTGPSRVESSLDDRFYAQLLHGHHIVPGSPDQPEADAIGARVSDAAAPLYGARFHFFIVNDPTPNAFVAFGSRVYVDSGLVHYVDNVDELAGVLCHEVSHSIHHDAFTAAVRQMRYDAATQSLVTRLERAAHGHLSQAIDAAGNFAEVLVLLHYSRAQEQRADLSGARVCARAGYNPWGLVWLFRKMDRDPRMRGARRLRWFSDHPSNAVRERALTKYITHNAAWFGSYPSDAPRARSRPATHSEP